MIGLAICVLSLFLPKFGAWKPVSYEGYRVYEVIENKINPPDMKQVSPWISVLRENRINSKEGQFAARSYLVPAIREKEFVKAVNEANAEYKVAVTDVGKLIEKERNSIETNRLISPNQFLLKVHLTYDEMTRILQHVSQVRNPGNGEAIAEVEDIGNTFEGKSMYGVKISSNHRQRKPMIFVEAGIHAREWVASATAMYMIKQLVLNYTHHADALRDIDFYIIPLSNPDGYEYSRIADRLWRKTRSMHFTGHYGVDGNRNFDFHWGESGSNDFPFSEVYRGPYPFSESETRNIRDAGLKYRDRIVIFISLHAFGPFLLYPWGFSGDVIAPNRDLLELVGWKASEAMYEFGGSLYQVGQIANLLYEASGGADDYFMGALNLTLSYTMELSSAGEFSFIISEDKMYAVAVEAFEGFKALAKSAIRASKILNIVKDKRTSVRLKKSRSAKRRGRKRKKKRSKRTKKRMKKRCGKKKGINGTNKKRIKLIFQKCPFLN